MVWNSFYLSKGIPGDFLNFAEENGYGNLAYKIGKSSL